MPPSRPFLCPVCGFAAGDAAPGPGGRPRASCPRCGSLERHRFLALLLELAVARLHDGLVVDVAPSAMLSPLIRDLAPTRYVSVDFDPDADGRTVSVIASLTDLPVRSDSADLLVCYHVLEHVPDDAAAMGQIARALRPGGVGLVQVPFRPGPTDEDPSAGPEERVRRFGQADHVRWYGDDFVDRLHAAGLAVLEITPAAILPADVVGTFALSPDEKVWIVASAPDGLPTVDGIRAAMLGAISSVAGRAADSAEASAATAAEAAAAAAQAAPATASSTKGHLRNGRTAAQWEAEAVRWRSSYEQLRSRWPVRAMVAVRAPFRRGRS